MPYEFWDSKGFILVDFLERYTQSILLTVWWHWRNRRHELQERGQKRKEKFSFSPTVPGPIPAFWQGIPFQNLGWLLCHVRPVVLTLHHQTFICLAWLHGLYRKHFSNDDYFNLSIKKWLLKADSCFCKRGYRFCFSSGENMYKGVVNMWVNKCKYSKTWSTCYTSLVCIPAVVSKRIFEGINFWTDSCVWMFHTKYCNRMHVQL
jgi:hypothetical protein